MRKMRKKSILILAVMMLSLLACNISVFAAEPVKNELTVTDTAQNVMLADMSTSGKNYDRDIYWCGNEMSMSDVTAKGDLLAAGYTLYVDGTDIGGSVRSASYGLNLMNVHVENNITAAGNILRFDQATTAKGIYACGNEISFSGECDALYIAGNQVVLNGTVNGDANIDGCDITIGPNAVVTGKLTVAGEYEPNIPDTAQINEYQYKESPNVPSEETIQEVSAAARLLHKLLNRIYWVPAMLLVALFFCLVMPGAIDGSGKMLLAKPVAMPVTGLVSVLAIPMTLILLCITFIGLPLAGLLTLLTLPIFIFAVPFVGASAGRLVFPKMNVWLASIIGSAALTLILAIPKVGGLVKFLCIIYLLGYLIQKCYEQIKMLGKKPETKAVVEENTGSQE